MADPTIYRLPNGLVVYQINRNETKYLYDEIFTQLQYSPIDLILPDAPIIVDVGANIGMFSLFALTRWRPERLVCLEPFPDLRHILDLNLQRFSEAEVMPVAVGKVRETAIFTYYPEYSIMSGRYCDSARDLARAKSFARWAMRSSPLKEEDDFEELLDGLLKYRFAPRPEKVDVWPLSLVIDECKLSRIDFLKVDVEGSELDVLKGIDDSDWKKLGYIAMEVDDTQGRLALIVDILRSHDMTCTVEQSDAYREDTLYLIRARSLAR